MVKSGNSYYLRSLNVILFRIFLADKAVHLVQYVIQVYMHVAYNRNVDQEFVAKISF